MRLKRWHLVLGFGAPLIASVALISVALAAVPTGCTFPASRDTFSAVVPGDRLLASFWNRILCLLHALQDEVDAVSTPIRWACTATSLAAGERKLVTVPFSGVPFSGSEPAFTSVKDPLSPSRLDDDGLESISGLDVGVWVFNRDALNARSGTVCAFVVE